MREILEQLMKLSEAPVKPGERKEISFSLKKLDKAISQLRDYQNSMAYLKNSESTLPASMKQKMQELQNELSSEIDKAQSIYDQVYNKSVNSIGTPIKMENLFKGLQKNCKEIIKVYKDLNSSSFKKQKFLYRGIRSSSDALYGKPFEARKPKDSNSELHTMLNDAMKNAGFVARRDNSTFTTGDRSQASGYGHSLYILFPVDGFKYTWSRTEKDLVLDNGKRLALLDKEVLKKLKATINKAKKDNPESDIEDPKYLFTDGYDYARNISYVQGLIDNGVLPNTAQELLDQLLSEQSMLDYFDFTNKDLFEAITSHREIYLDGPYYAINVNHINELIKFLQKVNTDSVELPEDFGTPPNTIEDGDIVKILNGPHKDKLGTVTYVYSNSYEIKIQNDENDVTIDKQDVELYKLPDGTTPVFNENDKVIVTNPNSYLYGEIGRISNLYSSGKTEFIPETDPGNSSYIWINELALYSPELAKELSGKPKPHKFTVGDIVTVTDENSSLNGQTGKITYIYTGPKYEVTFSGGTEYSFFKNQIKLADKNSIPDEIESSKTKDFKIGDKIKVTKGVHAGKTGTVEYVYISYPEVTVVFDNSDNDSKDIDVSNIEKLSDSEVSTDSEIKVGDMIQVINDESSYYGVVGEVIEMGQNSDGKSTVKFKTASYPSGIKTFADWVEKVGKTTEFKVGDKVKVKWEPSTYDGENGTIESGPDSDGDYKVLINGGGLTYVPSQGLQRLEDTPSAVSTKLEVGDSVKITGPSAYNNSSYIGYTGTITSISDDGKFAGVRVEDGNEDTILTYDVTSLSPPDQLSLNIGDEVKVTEYGSVFNGMTGVIDKGPDSDGDYVVVFNTGKWSYFKPIFLQKVENKKTPVADSTIEIGDTVKNIKDGHPHYGQTGKVQTTYSSGNVGLVYSDGTQAIDPKTYLEKVTELEKDELANIKWEPEPEVQTPAAPKFEVNDRVEVVSQFPSLIGMKGKITQTPSNMGFVSVWLDGNTAASSFPVSALKKIDEPKQTEEFYLGDMVEVTNPDLQSYGQKGKITDMDVSVLVIQDSSSGEVFFVKKSSVKKIG